MHDGEVRLAQRTELAGGVVDQLSVVGADFQRRVGLELGSRTRRVSGRPSSQVPEFPNSKFCDVKYAVSICAACAYSQRSGAECSAAREDSGARPFHITPSEIAVVESTERICMRGMRSGASELENGVQTQWSS